MNRFIVMSTIVFLGASAQTVIADGYFRGDSSVEMQFGGNISGALVELISPSDGSTTRTGAVTLSSRFRHRRTPLAFEGAVILTHGLLGAALIDFWRAEHWRVHGDVGIFKPFGHRQLSVTKVDRSGDLVLGFGAEAAVIGSLPRLNFTLDWRMYFPDPLSVPQEYGDFVRPIYKEAQRGAQLCIGASWLF